MAKIEIDEVEYAQRKALSDFVQSALSNPKTRRQVLEVQKALDPNRPIPELDASAPLMEEIKSLRDEMAADKKARLEAEQNREDEAKLARTRGRWNDGREKLKTRGYTEEGIKAIEKIMEDEGVLNHDIAAAHFDKLNPPPSPVTTGSNRWSFLPSKDDGGDDLMKKLMAGDDEGFLQGSLGQVFNDIRGGR